ncbi:enterochelin esterase [Planomonospora venezuelensis]|uniref:Enterochelin esterase family protein n=1 Tax=Planomonospora venezuelensis TaxID=1999 RepID=A0A841D5Y4_PLAVE|nr:enterochelin esterase [Planomonospora venezuelensis]MBB5965641.1 enterochelin esterase family protein [Planomonospora venezuelensis]GIN02484.1 enterochelin esterase [Planomonospora venezuelensis]
MRNVPPQIPCPCPPEVLAGRRVAALAADLRAGRAGALESFWAEAAARGTPLVEEIPGDPGHRAVTFLWRGDAEDVLVMANKITDPGVLGASLMERLDGTDVWHRTYRLRSGWRGSYRLAPRPAGTASQPIGGEAARRRDAMITAGSPAPRAAIERWCLGLAQAVADPFNPRTVGGHSVAELPDAPPQRWLAPRARAGGPDRRTVGGRTVWRLRPDRPPEGTLVLLDGECWLDDLPVLLGNLTEAGAVPPLTALLVQAGPPAARIRDLTCDDAFTAFLADELPSGGHPPARTVVAGQSLGGLTALYSAHRRPDRFGSAVSQSGSFWWPNDPGGPDDRDGPGGEWLTAELAAAGRVPARAYVEVGTYEWALLGPTRRLRDVLRAGGCELTYREYDGGHDHACWRGSLADGLIAALS